MLEIVCDVQLIHPLAVPPARGNDFAAGHDIRCVAGLEGLEEPHKWDEEQQEAWRLMERQGFVTLLPGRGFLFRTGFKQAIQPGFACFLWDRSGLGAKKQVGRLAGVIDEDYRGEWMVRLDNHSDAPVKITIGDSIVQGVYHERVRATFNVIDTLNVTDRGSTGFGSTDKPTT